MKKAPELRATAAEIIAELDALRPTHGTRKLIFTAEQDAAILAARSGPAHVTWPKFREWWAGRYGGIAPATDTLLARLRVLQGGGPR